MTRPTRVVAYTRVSTAEQAEGGVSLAAQRAKVEAYAALYELEIVAVVEDAGASAKSLDRPGLARALGILRAGTADALLVAKLDRLTRSVRDLGELVDRFFKSTKGRERALLSVGEQIDTRSAAGRMVLNILATIGQWEREAIGERTSDAMRHMRAEGRYTGGAAPYGFVRAPLGTQSGELVACAGEVAVITRARELRANGRSLRDIAAILEFEGHSSRAGTVFAPSAIADMVRT